MTKRSVFPGSDYAWPTPPPANAAVLLLRRSDPKKDNCSIEDQEYHTRRYADRENLQVIATYIDEGITGRSDTRAALDQCMADAARRRFHQVIVYRLDRFARNTRMQLNRLADLERLGIAILSVSENLEYKSAAGRFMFTNLAAAAQYQSDQLSERIKAHVEMKVSKGRWHGPVPTGYMRERLAGADPDAPRQIVLSGDAEGPRLAFQLYRTRLYSYLTLAEELNARGYKVWNPQRQEHTTWSAFTVRETLSNPFYTGVVTHKGIQYPGQHPALIDQATWDAVQAIRAERAAQHGPLRIGRAHDASDAGVLAGLTYCARCGGRSWFQGASASNRAYYKCANRYHHVLHDGERCDAPASNGRTIDDLLLRYCQTLQWTADAARDHVQLAQRKAGGSATPRPRVNVTAIHAQLERLQELYVAGDLSKAVYQAKRAKLHAQLTTSAPEPQPSLDVTGAAATLRNLGTVLEYATAGERRALLRHLFHAVWLDKHTIRAITPTPIFEPLLEAATVVAAEKMCGCEPGGCSAHPHTFPPLILPVWKASQLPRFAA